MSPSKTRTASPRNRHDQPVRLPQFRRSLRIRKIVLGITIPAVLVLHTIWIVFSVRNGWGGWPGKGWAGSSIWEWINLGLMVCLGLIYLVSLHPKLSDGPLYQKHASITTLLFFLSIFSLLTYPLPPVIYIIKTHLSPQPHPSRLIALDVLFYVKIGMSFLTFLALGTMRRGPKLYFEPHKLSIGYGWAMEERKIEEREQEDNSLRKTDKNSWTRFGIRSRRGNRIRLEEDENEPLISSEEERESTTGAESETDERESNVLDYYNSSIFDLLVVAYIWPLALITLNRPELHPEDLPQMPEALRAENLQLPRGEGTFVKTIEEVEQVEREQADGKTRVQDVGKEWTSWTLLKAACKGQGWVIAFSIWFEALYVSTTFLPRYCMHEIIETFEQDDRKSDMAYAYLMVFGLFFGNFAGHLISCFARIRENLLNHKAISVNLRTFLFAKILKTIDDQSPESAGQGRAQILNLMNIDVRAISSLATRIYNLSNSSVMLALSGGFLYSMFSYSAFIGLATLPLISPASGIVMKLIYRCDQDLAKARDARIGAMREMLSSIKVIKLNGWEEHHHRRISRLREKEVALQRYRFTLGTAFNIVAEVTPVAAIFVMFLSYTKLEGKRLRPAEAFVATTVFSQVRESFNAIPETLQNFLTAKVSLDRICAFLNTDDAQLINEQQGSKILMDQVCTTWPSRDPNVHEAGDRVRFELRDITVNIPDAARFILVCGPTGAGKTLFLLSLLGEARLLSGTIVAPRSRYGAIPLADELDTEPASTDWIDEGTVAYAAQIPYIPHGTIQEAILFGLAYEPVRYQAVVNQCALATDFTTFEHGDQQEIGASGFTLSGGQRARISLARAVYSRAKTIYIDDLLSSLDATTSQYIYAHCFRGILSEDRRVIMVSHNVTMLLPAADYVLQIAGGKLARSGLPKELKNVLLKEEEQTVEEEFAAMIPLATEKAKSVTTTGSTARRIYEEEKREQGNVKGMHYSFLVDNVGGSIYWMVFAALMLGAQISFFMTRVVLQWWTGDFDSSHLNYWLWIWGVLAIVRSIMSSARWFWLYGNSTAGFTQRAAARMHSQMLARLLRAPLRYFEKTPAGRILNRFSGDISCVDGAIPDAFGRSIMETLEFGSSVAALGVTVPAVWIAGALLVYPFNQLRLFFGKLKASLARLEKILASPISGITYEVIGSIVTVRGYGSSRYLSQIFSTFEDIGNRQGFCGWSVWMSFSTSMLSLSSILLGATGLLLLHSDANAARAGFVLSFGLDISLQLFWLLDRVVNFEENMVSVERIAEIAELTPEDEGQEDLQVPADWPRTGTVSVQNLAVRYDPDLPFVLNDVSFSLQSGERTAIVGRTGCGKSTTTLCLLGDLKPSAGRIEIDGIDISTIPLHILRTKLSFIPQESLLTSGTIRDALDITGQKDDHEIYAALRQVHLETTEGSPFSNLDTLVSSGGMNFSLGERQLLVLARAILKKSRIVIMDEATSSVDYEMDAKITDTIRESFRGTTMITIAHRLRTIIDYDKVIVLKEGKVVENGSPAHLIRQVDSEFRRLCMADGPIEYEHLMSIAGRGM